MSLHLGSVALMGVGISRVRKSGFNLVGSQFVAYLISLYLMYYNH